jgi:hypothetical protein
MHRKALHRLTRRQTRIYLVVFRIPPVVSAFEIRGIAVSKALAY